MMTMMATFPSPSFSTLSSTSSFHGTSLSQQQQQQLPWKLPTSPYFSSFPLFPSSSAEAVPVRNGTVSLSRRLSRSRKNPSPMSVSSSSSSSSSSPPPPPPSIGDVEMEELFEQESSSPLEAFCCRNSPFLESSESEKIRRIVEAGGRRVPAISISSQKDSAAYTSSSLDSSSSQSQDSPSSPPCILVFLGSEAFMDHIFEAFPDASVQILHFCLDVLSSIKEKHDDARCFYIIDATDFSEISGSFDTIFLNYFPIFSISLSTLLEDAVTHCKPGGNIVISLGKGKTNLAYLKDQSQGLIPSLLPDKDELMKTVSLLPLELISFEDTPSFYLAILMFKGADHRRIQLGLEPIAAREEKQFPLYASGNVIHGIGRGSKQLGFPTANLSVASLPTSITQLTNGVYYGCAQVIGSGVDSSIYRMVMNLGNRPTFDGDNISLEVHILHDYGVDFYGTELRLAILGFIREEMKFSSVDELIKRIKKDVEFMRTHLTTIDFETEKRSSFFVTQDGTPQ